MIGGKEGKGGGFGSFCLFKFQRKKSTVGSWTDCEHSVSLAAHSRRLLLRVCTLFSRSPAVGRRLLTFPRSHDRGWLQRGLLPPQDPAVVSALASSLFVTFTTCPATKAVEYRRMKFHPTHMNDLLPRNNITRSALSFCISDHCAT